MVLKLTRLDGSVVSYVVPTAHEALQHSKATQGTQFDKLERKNFTGGLPMVWARVQ